MDWKKSLKKIGKGLGLLAAAGAVDALSGGQLVALLAPLGPFAPIAVLGAQAGLTILSDWLKHKNDPPSEG